MTAADRLWRAAALVASAAFHGLLALVTAFARRSPWPKGGALEKLRRRAEPAADFRRAILGLGERRPLWCHVASAGELEEALPILERLRADDPSRPVVLTCFSASGLAAAERERRRRPVPWDVAGPMAADGPLAASRFVRTLRPSRALFVHRELWPWHLRALERARVPAALVQVRAGRAVGTWRAVAPWLRRFALVGTVDDGAERAMRELLGGKGPVATLGDARVDRIVERVRRADGAPGDAILLASVWPEDVRALAPALASEALRRRPLVVVPHEPEPGFVEAIGRRLADAGWKVRSAPGPARAGEAEVVATVGGLAERYREAAIAFVGGSFRARVHNVLEPAASGCAVVTGPFTANAPDAAGLERAGALRHVTGADGFRAVIVEWEDGRALERARAAARGYVERRRGAGARSAEALRRAWTEV